MSVAAPSISQRILKENSDNILPFIILITPISCDDSNPLWRLAFPKTSLKHDVDDMIDHQLMDISEEFTELWNVIIFVDFSAFTVC